MPGILYPKPKVKKIRIAPPSPKTIAPPKEVLCPPEIPNSYGIFHKREELQFPHNIGLLHRPCITVAGLITGCGLAQSYGWTSLNTLTYSNYHKEIKKWWEDVVKPLKVDGVGAIIATLGKTYTPNYEQHLLALGFEKLKTYSNYRHGQDGLYTQSIYIYTIK